MAITSKTKHRSQPLAIQRSEKLLLTEFLHLLLLGKETKSLLLMTSYINVKNKKGLTKLASLIKEAGFNDVKVIVKSKSIILTPSNEIDIQAGLADLKAGRYVSFEKADDAITFLNARIRTPKKSLNRKK